MSAHPQKGRSGCGPWASMAEDVGLGRGALFAPLDAGIMEKGTAVSPAPGTVPGVDLLYKCLLNG